MNVSANNRSRETERCLCNNLNVRKSQLEQRLQEKTSRDVEIQTIDHCCIMMKILLPDKKTKDYMEILVETGVFDDILKEMFITDEFKWQCRVKSVNVKTVVLDQSGGTCTNPGLYNPYIPFTVSLISVWVFLTF